jgi:ferredoxin
MSAVIRQERLRELAGLWAATGVVVAAPVEVKPGLILYARVADGTRMKLDGFIRPANSIKEFVFPRHEKLYGYRIDGRGVELSDAEVPDTPQVILGARPCDAAALPVLDHIFDWDYRDEFYFRRRAATTVVTLACASHDGACFCTSVGLGPAHEKGSDALLLDLGGGEYEVRALTGKGRALFEGAAAPSGRSAPEIAGPPVRFKNPEVEFDSPVYQRRTLSCLGCGACAYTCPTCHCFDIADVGGPRGGARVKNWDSCQFALFTLHASGHNPRGTQPERQRQRIYHKFRMYPEKFGEILCTGCGNCQRNCPVGLGVLSVLEAL